MSRDGLRAGERAVEAPAARDAHIVFIGRIHTPWTSRAETPRQGSLEGPVCRVEVFEPWVAALQGIDAFSDLDIVYWLDQARRDLLLQTRSGASAPKGTFALRSPMRPNPIGLSRVRLEGVDGAILRVRGLDCLDGTPLVDIKPERCPHSSG